MAQENILLGTLIISALIIVIYMKATNKTLKEIIQELKELKEK